MSNARRPKSQMVRVTASSKWRPDRPALDGFQIVDGRGAVIWCRTRACADYIAQLLRVGPTTERSVFERINRALGAELDPLTRFPPAHAGDVIGHVQASASAAA